MEEYRIDPKTLRTVASCFATGVTVVSVRTPEGEIHGMTASSFLSVSLSPPLVLFSVMHQNQMNEYLCVGVQVGISILTDEMEGVSNHFAKMTVLENPPAFIEQNETPILSKAHAWYATKVKELIPAGDHVLVLCEVEKLAANKEDNPLIYYQGYKKLK